MADLLQQKIKNQEKNANLILEKKDEGDEKFFDAGRISQQKNAEVQQPRRLSRNEIAENAIKSFDEKIRMEAWESPIGGIDTESLGELLKRMKDDTNKKSPLFLNMQNAIENLVQMKEKNAQARAAGKDIIDYRDALSHAESIVRIYKRDHARAFFVRTYPAQRYQISCRLLELVRSLRTDIGRAITKDIEGTEEEKEKEDSVRQSINEIIETGAFSAEEAGKEIKDWLDNDKGYKDILKRIVGNQKGVLGDKETLLKFIENKNRLLIANKVALSLLCDAHPELTFHIPGLKKRFKSFVEERMKAGSAGEEMLYSDIKTFQGFLNDCVSQYKEKNKDYLDNVQKKRQMFIDVVKVSATADGLWNRPELERLLTDDSISMDVFTEKVAEFAQQKADNEQIVQQIVDGEKYSLLLSASLKQKIREKLGSLMLFGGELEIADQTRKYLDIKNYLCPKEAGIEDDTVTLMQSWNIPAIQKDAFVLYLTQTANTKQIEKLSSEDADRCAKEFSQNLLRSAKVIEKSGIKRKKLTKNQWEEFDAIRRFSGNYTKRLLKNNLRGIMKAPTDGSRTMSLAEFEKKHTTKKKRGIGLSQRLLGDQFLAHEDMKNILKGSERTYLKEQLMPALFASDEARAFLEYSSAIEIRRMGRIMRKNISENSEKIVALRKNEGYDKAVKLRVLLRLATAGDNLGPDSFEKLLKSENEEFLSNKALKKEMKDVKGFLRKGKAVDKATELKAKAYKARMRALMLYEGGRYRILAPVFAEDMDFYRAMMEKTEEEFVDYIRGELDEKFAALGEAVKQEGSGAVLKRDYVRDNYKDIISGKTTGSVIEWKRRLRAYSTAIMNTIIPGSKKTIDENIETAVKDAYKELKKRHGKDTPQMALVLNASDHFIGQMLNNKKQFKNLLKADSIRDRVVGGVELYLTNRDMAYEVFKRRLKSANSPFFGEKARKKRVRMAQFGKFVSDSLYDDKDFAKNIGSLIDAFEKEHREKRGEEKAPENIEEIREEIRQRQDVKKANELKNSYLGFDDKRIGAVLNDVYAKKSIVNIGTKNNVDLSHKSQKFVRDNLVAKLSSLIGDNLTPMVVDCIVEKNLASWATELLGRTPGIGWIMEKLDAEGSSTVLEHALWLSRVRDVLSIPDEGEDEMTEDELNLMLVNVYRHEKNFKKEGSPLNALDRKTIKGKWYETFRKNYKELRKLERIRVNHPSLEQERVGLSRDLRALLATGLGIKDQDKKASVEFEQLAKKGAKYIGFVSGFYDLIGEKMEESKEYAGLNEYTRNIYIERIRAYFNTEFMHDISDETEGDVSIDTTKWSSLVEALLSDPHKMRFIKNAEQTISSEKEAARNKNFAEVHGRETIDAVIENYAWKGQRNKYNALSLQQKELFALALMIMDKSATGLSGGSNDVLNEPELRKQEVAQRMAELSRFVQGKAYDFRIDYAKAYYKLVNYGYNSVNSLGMRLSDTAFNKAMEFALGIEKRMNAATAKDISRIEDTLSTVNEAALLGKAKNAIEVNSLRKERLDFADVKNKLMYYASADMGAALSALKHKNAKSSQKDLIEKESDTIERVSERLANISGEDMRRLIVILQNRTALDKSSVDPNKFINTGARDELKLLLSDERAGKELGRFLSDAACHNALISALSFHVKDDTRLDDKALSRSNFEEKSFGRAGIVDWEVLENAFALMDELDKEYLARFAVRNAKDYIEQSGNTKAYGEYEKYKQEKNMDGERLSMILSEQAKKDAEEGSNQEAVLFVAGFKRLSAPQKNLFFKVLENRDLLDISKKNLYRNIWSPNAERGFVNEAGRFALIDEYIDSSIGGNSGVVLKENAHYEALRSLLSTQVDDTVDFKSTENVKNILAGEKYFIFKRNTAIDWKLFSRALQFVNRADYELKIREGNAELYRSAGELSKYGHMSMDYGILRRNIHNTGSNLLRFGTQRTKEFFRKDYVPTSKLAGGVAEALNFASEFLPKSASGVTNEIVREFLNPKAEDEVTKSKRTYIFKPWVDNAEVLEGRSEAQKGHVTEIDYIQDKIDNILANEKLMEQGAEEVGKAISIFLADPYKGGEFKDKKREDILAKEIKGHEAPFRYGDVRDTIANVKGKYGKVKGVVDDYLGKADVMDKIVGSPLKKLEEKCLNHLKLKLIEKYASSFAKKKDGTDAEKIKAAEDEAKKYFGDVLKGMFGKERAKELEGALKATETFTDGLREKLTWVSAVMTTAKNYADSFADVAKRVKNKEALSRGIRAAERFSVEEADADKLYDAKAFQSKEQNELAKNTALHHRQLQEIATKIAGDIQNVEISRDLIGAAVQTGAIMAQSLGAGAAAVSMVSSAVKLGVDFALYAIRVLKDRNTLKDYYTITETGSGVLNGILKNAKETFKETANKNGSIKDDDVLGIVCKGLGYEKEDELVEDTGMKLAASVAYSASSYNPILQNKIMATTVMTVLGLKDKAGRTDSDTITGIFNAMKAA